MSLGYKQRESHEHFLQVEQDIRSIVSRAELDNEIEKKVAYIRKVVGRKRFGVAWSGGKDSVVVELLTSMALGGHPTAMGMTHDLEYPEFMRWVTHHMPQDFKVYNSGHSLEWLAKNPHWLFPKTSSRASRWFKVVQHAAQEKFVAEKGLECLILGRRRKDYNNTGTDGVYKHKDGALRFSPIYDWSHELVLACMSYYGLPRAPFYSWPNGYVVGSGNWAARQWEQTDHEAWHAVTQIDASIVMRASKYLKSADEYVRSMGL